MYDLKTDENYPSFLPASQKATHHMTYAKLLKNQKPQTYIFATNKYISSVTMIT